MIFKNLTSFTKKKCPKMQNLWISLILYLRSQFLFKLIEIWTRYSFGNLEEIQGGFFENFDFFWFYANFGPRVYSNRACRLVHPSLNISKTAHSIFLELCMKLGVNKVKKVTLPEFWKKVLIQGLRGIKGIGGGQFLLFWYMFIALSFFFPKWGHTLLSYCYFWF